MINMNDLWKKLVCRYYDANPRNALALSCVASLLYMLLVHMVPSMEKPVVSGFKFLAFLLASYSAIQKLGLEIYREKLDKDLSRARAQSNFSLEADTNSKLISMGKDAAAGDKFGVVALLITLFLALVGEI